MEVLPVHTHTGRETLSPCPAVFEAAELAQLRFPGAAFPGTELIKGAVRLRGTAAGTGTQPLSHFSVLVLPLPPHPAAHRVPSPTSAALLIEEF